MSDTPHVYSVGDGCHSGSGDSYPYRVIRVSDSGKTIWCTAMGHRAVKPTDGSELQMGHQSWECYDYPLEEGEEPPVSMIATLRSNGKWVQKGVSMNAGYCRVYPGAHYHYVWEY